MKTIAMLPIEFILDEFIVHSPPEGPWQCKGELYCKSLQYLFELDKVYDPRKIKFMPLQTRPMLSVGIPVGRTFPDVYLVFVNIEVDVEKQTATLEKRFREKCGIR